MFFYEYKINENRFVLKNIPQARQLGFSQSENGAPRVKKILPLEQNYSVSERQICLRLASII